MVDRKAPILLASALAAFISVAAADADDVSAAAACAPSKVGELILTGQADDIAMTGTTIYTIGGAQTLGQVTVDFLAIDATNRTAPTIRGFNTFAADGSPSSIEVAGNYAYSATSRGLVIMDIVNRLSPVHLPTVTLPSVNSVKLRVSNGRAYVIGTTFPGPSRLYVVDVGDPANARILGNYPEASQVFYDLEVAGNTAYVATHLSAGNLLIIDVTDPASPVKAGTFTEPGINRISNVAQRGNLLIAIGETADFSDHLLVIDITNRIAPRRMAKIDLETGGAQDIAVAGDRAIILDARRGRLVFFDISRPEQTSQIGELSLSTPFQFAAEGSTAAVLLFSTRAVALYDIGTCLASAPRRRAVGRK